MHLLTEVYSFDDSLTQYGDGVFETMLAVGNFIHHWEYHWQRLESSCQRLQITVPDRELLLQQLHSEIAEYGNEFSVVKMIVSRGAGLRGYRSHKMQPCHVQFRISPYQFTPTLYQGLTVRVCQTRLSSQPLLAGMKHINRLEYIMARREADDAMFDEGLLLDYDNHLIEGIISNIFMIQKQRVVTPTLASSGVAGTMRAYLIDQLPTWGYEVVERSLTLDEVVQADGLFLSNATAGVMPVLRIDGLDKVFDIGISGRIRQQAGHPCCEQ